MANVAKTKTVKQKAVEAALKSLTAARDTFQKTQNANTKGILDNAERAYQAARDAERRERFTTVGRDRALLVSTKLAAMAKCANKKAYEFTEADIAKIEAMLTQDLANTLATFRAALAGAPPLAKTGMLSFD